MSATEVHSPSHDAAAGTVDMRLEVQIIPVSDVDRVSGDTPGTPDPGNLGKLKEGAVAVPPG